MKEFIWSLWLAFLTFPALLFIESLLKHLGVIGGLFNGKSCLDILFAINPLLGFIVMVMGGVGLIRAPEAWSKYHQKFGIFGEPAQTDSDKDK